MAQNQNMLTFANLQGFLPAMPVVEVNVFNDYIDHIKQGLVILAQKVTAHYQGGAVLPVYG